MSETTGLLKEPWEYFERQREAGTFGIWVFLASEMLFFGALILTYTACRLEHVEAFAAAGRETEYLVRDASTPASFSPAA